MKKIFFLGIAANLLLFAFLFTGIIGESTILNAQSGPVRYKVVSYSAMNMLKPAEYEKLLNDMTAQGWKWDHNGASGMEIMIVFKK